MRIICRPTPAWRLPPAVLCAVLCVGFVSCGTDEDDAPGVGVADVVLEQWDGGVDATDPDARPQPVEPTDAGGDAGAADPDAGTGPADVEDIERDEATPDAVDAERDASETVPFEDTTPIEDTADAPTPDGSDASGGDASLADGDAADAEAGDADDAAVDAIDGDAIDAAAIDGDGSDTGPSTLYAPVFVPISAGALTEHAVVTPEVPINGFTYGYGMAPLDADGDGDLDLFVGTLPTSTAAACVYENVSTPGTIVFSRRDAWCFPRTDGFVSGVGIDTDGDGAYELVAQSEDETVLIRFSPTVSVSPGVPEPSACTLGPLVTVDINWDGWDEVVVSCKPDVRTPGGLNFGQARVLSVGPAGLANDRRFWTRIEENTIGLGLVDLAGDGLLDIVTVNDTFMSPDAFNPTVPPSSFHERQPPGAEQQFVRRASGEGGLAYGSHMGYELVGRPGESDIHVFADRGAVLPRVYAAPRFLPPRGWRLPVEPFVIGGAGEDSWGVLHSDWNGDGHPDLFLSFGRASPDGDAGRAAPLDAVLMSDPETGMLSYDPFAYPMPLPELYPDPVYGLARSSRGALRLDLDGDRREEWIIAAANGPPRVITVLDTAPRCTLIPTPRLVPTAGGYRIVGPDGVSLPGPAHGENLSHDGDRLLTHVLSGTLVFPSGARVPYDCGAEPSVEVVEPDWLQAIGTESGVEIVYDAEVWGGSPPAVVRGAVAFRAGGGTTVEARRSGDRWVLDVAPEGVLQVMVQLDERWIARWLLL